MIWKPHATVAAVVERNGRYLLVEEFKGGRKVLNQPAGHLENGESLVSAVIREAREETAWEIEPYAVVGLYRWIHPASGETFLRLCFAAQALRHHAGQPLDAGIDGTDWLSREEILDRRERLRSPLVLRAVEDYEDGTRYPLELLREVGDC